jgi:hypothetical protein
VSWCLRFALAPPHYLPTSPSHHLSGSSLPGSSGKWEIPLAAIHWLDILLAAGVNFEGRFRTYLVEGKMNSTCVRLSRGRQVDPDRQVRQEGENGMRMAPGSNHPSAPDGSVRRCCWMSIGDWLFFLLLFSPSIILYTRAWTIGISCVALLFVGVVIGNAPLRMVRRYMRRRARRDQNEGLLSRVEDSVQVANVHPANLKRLLNESETAG